MPAAVILTREMGISHRDFFRIFPAVVDRLSFERTDTGVRCGDGARSLEITLDPEGERRIAQLRIPVTAMRLVFRGYDADQIRAFMERFERHFHRGGG